MTPAASSDPRTWIGLGAMRLSDVDPARAAATLEVALSRGANLIDTADVYGASEGDRHGNERWLASRVPAGVTLATKGGLVRSAGRWRPDGRAKAIRAACEGSRGALGRAAIDLYQLHAPDPKTPLATTARALARLVADGQVRSVGLCNVGVDQLRGVQAHVAVSAVQVALSPFDGASIRGQVIEHCQAAGIRVLAHSPFGGPRRAHRVARDPALSEVARTYGVSPYTVVLAWLYDLGVVPLPGPTRPEHAADVGLAARLTLSDADRKVLDHGHPLGAWLRVPRGRRRPPPSSKGEVVVVIGMPAAGKTTAVRALTARGYARFNRDEAKGTMAKLHRQLERHLGDGGGPAVLDNTYPTRAARHEVLEVAWKYERSVRCIWIDTPLEDAQLNAVTRLWSLFGRLPSPEEIRDANKRMPNVFFPQVQFNFRDAFEPPGEDEGFSRVERRPFVRAPWPEGRAGTLIAEDVLFEAETRRRVDHRPGPVGIVAWWPGLSAAERARRRDRFSAATGKPAHVFDCTHAVTERCWCLLPLPGLGYAAIRTLGLAPGRSVWLGRGATHGRAAARLGVPYVEIPPATLRET